MVKINFYFFLVFSCGLFACQNSGSKPGEEKNNEAAEISGRQTGKLKEAKTVASGSVSTETPTSETGESEVKKITARLIFAEIHPAVGYTLEFKDKKDKSYFFHPDNKTYDSFKFDLVDFNTRQATPYFKNLDFDLTYTEAEGENEFTGDKEIQLHCKTLKLAENEWNHVHNKISYGWTLEYAESDGKKEAVPLENAMILMLSNDWTVSMQETIDKEPETGKWKLSDDMKTLIFTHDEKEEKISLISVDNNNLVLLGPDGKLYFARQENGD